MVFVHARNATLKTAMVFFHSILFPLKICQILFIIIYERI